MTEHRQTYDPYRLIDEVQELLRQRGLDPRIPPGQFATALEGAGTLLRACGITPAMEPADALAPSMDRSWPDIDDHRATS